MANIKNKITKKDNYAILTAVLDKAEEADIALTGTTYDNLRAFIDREVELLDNKAAAAQKRAADKKEEGDTLRSEVLNALSDTEFTIIDDVVAKLEENGITNQDGSKITRNMVSSRLTQLLKLDIIEKDMVPATEGKSRKVAAYRRKA